MKMYRNLVAFTSLTLVLTSLSFAQGPVLSDGSSPFAMGFQGASGQSALPTNDPIPQSHLITPEQLNHIAGDRQAETADPEHRPAGRCFPRHISPERNTWAQVPATMVGRSCASA